MTRQLLIGPPSKPFTKLDEANIKKITDRLSLVLDTTGFDDEMAPVIRNTIETLITQDLPALLAYVVTHKAPGVAEAEIDTRLWPLVGAR